MTHFLKILLNKRAWGWKPQAGWGNENPLGDWWARCWLGPLHIATRDILQFQWSEKPKHCSKSHVMPVQDCNLVLIMATREQHLHAMWSQSAYTHTHIHNVGDSTPMIYKQDICFLTRLTFYLRIQCMSWGSSRVDNSLAAAHTVLYTVECRQSIQTYCHGAPLCSWLFVLWVIASSELWWRIALTGCWLDWTCCNCKVPRVYCVHKQLGIPLFKTLKP